MLALLIVYVLGVKLCLAFNFLLPRRFEYVWKDELIFGLLWPWHLVRAVLP